MVSMVSTRRPWSARAAAVAAAAVGCVAVTVPVAAVLRQSEDCGPLEVADGGSSADYGAMAPGEVIVKFHDDVPSEDRAAILCEVGATTDRVLATGAELLEVADAQGEPAEPRLLVAVIRELESRSEVDYAAPNDLVDAH